MTENVDLDVIELVVKAKRHPTQHIARAVSADLTVYILHSKVCKSQTKDLRTCAFSIALDKGIAFANWPNDVAVYVEVGESGKLLAGAKVGS